MKFIASSRLQSAVVTQWQFVIGGSGTAVNVAEPSPRLFCPLTPSPLVWSHPPHWPSVTLDSPGGDL